MILISLPGWEKDLRDDKQELVPKRKMDDVLPALLATISGSYEMIGPQSHHSLR